MKHDTRRITLISRHKQLPQRAWDSSRDAKRKIIFVDSFAVLRYTATNPLVNMDADVERIILDRSSSASDYLALLAELPQEFRGDVLMIRDDQSGFLSAMGRGGDRVLYALSSQDLEFYLETHDLIDPNSETSVDPQGTVFPFRPLMNAVA